MVLKNHVNLFVDGGWLEKGGPGAVAERDLLLLLNRDAPVNRTLCQQELGDEAQVKKAEAPTRGTHRWIWVDQMS